MTSAECFGFVGPCLSCHLARSVYVYLCLSLCLSFSHLVFMPGAESVEFVGCDDVSVEGNSAQRIRLRLVGFRRRRRRRHRVRLRSHRRRRRRRRRRGRKKRRRRRRRRGDACVRGRSVGAEVRRGTHQRNLQGIAKLEGGGAGKGKDELGEKGGG